MTNLKLGKTAFAIFAFLAGATFAMSAPHKFTPNYDESKADIFKKLDTLDKIGEDGKIESALQWLNCERPKVIAFLENEYFGKMPPRPLKTEFELVESSDDALGNTALRRQYKIVSTDTKGSHSFDVLIYIPKNSKGKVPVFLNANFSGNHTVCAEKEILLPKCYLRNGERYNIKDHRANDSQRGKAAYRHVVESIIARGYAVVTFCYCDVYPDMDSEKKDGAAQSIYKIFDKSKLGKNPRSVAAWAWGNCTSMDLIETMPELDAKRICVVGHSRIGKTALLTGAYDKRVACTVSNSSCCGGAAMNRRNFGETLEFATQAFPYWYLPEMKKYANNVEAMPIDQQHLIACIAPRPVCIISGTEDFWADPKGEYLSLVEACKIYSLFGAKKLPKSAELPAAQTPFNGDVGHFIYKGKHDIGMQSWNFIMDYTDSLGWKN